MENFQALGAPPPDPKTAPSHFEFLATRLAVYSTRLQNFFRKAFDQQCRIVWLVRMWTYFKQQWVFLGRPWPREHNLKSLALA